uniref:Uncharacterized protein n=1 Tax=viral metagenome TaxID=1070528 RepID=A0A6H1ZR40_9ZZZZ
MLIGKIELARGSEIYCYWGKHAKGWTGQVYNAERSKFVGGYFHDVLGPAFDIPPDLYWLITDLREGFGSGC